MFHARSFCVVLSLLIVGCSRRVEHGTLVTTTDRSKIASARERMERQWQGVHDEAIQNISQYVYESRTLSYLQSRSRGKFGRDVLAILESDRPVADRVSAADVAIALQLEGVIDWYVEALTHGSDQLRKGILSDRPIGLGSTLVPSTMTDETKRVDRAAEANLESNSPMVREAAMQWCLRCRSDALRDHADRLYRSDMKASDRKRLVAFLLPDQKNKDRLQTATGFADDTTTDHERVRALGEIALFLDASNPSVRQAAEQYLAREFPTLRELSRDYYTSSISDLIEIIASTADRPIAEKLLEPVLNRAKDDLYRRDAEALLAGRQGDGASRDRQAITEKERLRTAEIIQKAIADGWITAQQASQWDPDESLPADAPLLTLLAVAGKLHWFDVETGWIPVHHDLLIAELADVAGEEFPLETVWESPFGLDTGSGRYQIELIVDRTLFGFALADLGDWYDLKNLINGLNAIQEFRKVPQRFVLFGSDGQMAQVGFGDPSRFQAAGDLVGPLSVTGHQDSYESGKAFENEVREKYLDELVQ